MNKSLAPEATTVPCQEEKYTFTYIAFVDCSECHGKGYLTIYTAFHNSYKKQCETCFVRNEDWKKTFPVYYRVQRFPWYEYTDWFLDKAGNWGERKRNHQPKQTFVTAFALINGEQVPLYLEKGDLFWHFQKEFKTIEDAQAWIATQGSIKDFWTGIQQKTEEIAL